MVAKRIAAAFVVLAVLGGALTVDYLVGLDILFNVFVIVGTVIVLLEFYGICEGGGQTPFRAFGVVASLLLVALHWLSLPGTMEGLGLAGRDRLMGVRAELVPLGLLVAVLGTLWLQATKRDNAHAFESIGATLLGVLYVWFLPSFMVRLRHLGPGGQLGAEGWGGVGTWLLIACILTSKFSDIGAFFVGTFLGRRKLIPRISPKKTWEGVMGGLMASVVTAVIVFRIGLPELVDVWRSIAFGFFVGGLGQFGDLAESLMKRAGGTKDAGSIIPGFGGFLDVVDSLTISAPVAYIIAIFMLGGGS